MRGPPDPGSSHGSLHRVRPAPPPVHPAHDRAHRVHGSRPAARLPVLRGSAIQASARPDRRAAPVLTPVRRPVQALRQGHRAARVRPQDHRPLTRRRPTSTALRCGCRAAFAAARFRAGSRPATIGPRSGAAAMRAFSRPAAIGPRSGATAMGPCFGSGSRSRSTAVRSCSGSGSGATAARSRSRSGSGSAAMGSRSGSGSTTAVRPRPRAASATTWAGSRAARRRVRDAGTQTDGGNAQRIICDNA